MAEESADVVVVGFGIAGCTAAITAHDGGARVVILEKATPGDEGGNSRVSGSCWLHSEDWEAAGVYLRSLSAEEPPPEPVVRTWMDEVALNTEWVVSLGGQPSLHPGSEPPEFPELAGSDGYAGMLHVGETWGNSRLWLLLRGAVESRGIEVRMGTPALDLRLLGGRVVGVDCGGETPGYLAATSAVVLATGGFENNPDMVRQHLGLPQAVPWGSPSNTGDGHRLAQKAGADLWHMGNYMPIVGIAAGGLRTGLHIRPRGGYIYTDRTGRRFNEFPGGGHGRALQDGRYQTFPPGPMLVVFDEVARRGGPLVPPRAETPYSWSHLVSGYSWSDDNRAEVEEGVVCSAPDVRSLAVALGADPDEMERSVETYNAACRGEREDPVGRPRETLVAMAEPPYYGVASPPLIGFTCGGPRRDERARILDVEGRPIPGLYAAGEISSTYSRSLDGGMMVADAMAFGRVAGREAAAQPARRVVPA